MFPGSDSLQHLPPHFRKRLKNAKNFTGTSVKSCVQDGIHQIVIRTLSGFRYLCQKLAYLVLSRIFLIASQINELLESYQDYSAKSVGKQGGEFLIAALVKS
jgi:hypothetical protein